MTLPRLSAAWTITALVVVACISAFLALLFVLLWTNHIDEQEELYFEREGLNRAADIQKELEGRMAQLVEREGHKPYDRWDMPFALLFDQIANDVDASFAVDADEIALIVPAMISASNDGVVARIGTFSGNCPKPGPFGDGLQTVAQRKGNQTLVFAWGKIGLPDEPDVSELVERNYHFRCILRYRSLRGVGESSRTYAIFLVLFYLLMLWLILVFVYLLARRQLALRVQAEEKTIRLNAMSQVAEGIAHEVRNPLNGISLNVQFLQKLQEKGKGASGEDYERVYGELKKIQYVIDDFVSFSRLQDIEPETMDFGEVLETALSELETLRGDVDVDVKLSSVGDTELRADRGKLIQAMKHILRNAFEALALEEKRELEIRVEGDRTRIQILVANSGREVPAHVLQSMFDPFFTTRSSAMGLGLTLAKTIIEAHGGKIAARPGPEGGCCIDIELRRRF